jgi:hypothetical protein
MWQESARDSKHALAKAISLVMPGAACSQAACPGCAMFHDAAPAANLDGFFNAV